MRERQEDGEDEHEGRDPLLQVRSWSGRDYSHAVIAGEARRKGNYWRRVVGRKLSWPPRADAE